MPKYLVTIKNPVDASNSLNPVRERLVDAPNEARALRHVVDDTIEIRIATVEDAMRLAPAGVAIEKAAEK